MFTRFDLTCVVVEPTLASLSVYQQYQAFARGYGVQVCAIGNQIATPADLAFVQAHLGADLLAWCSRSAFVRAQEQGHYAPFAHLEPANQQALTQIRAAVDAIPQDWERFYAQAVTFHRQNAASWMNTTLGVDVTDQIDPDFQPWSAYTPAIIRS